jgi:hypothetical protein
MYPECNRALKYFAGARHNTARSLPWRYNSVETVTFGPITSKQYLRPANAGGPLLSLLRTPAWRFIKL